MGIHAGEPMSVTELRRARGASRPPGRPRPRRADPPLAWRRVASWPFALPTSGSTASATSANPRESFSWSTTSLPGEFPQPAVRRPARTAMRVVIADDSVLLREGVARLLEEAGFEVVGAVGKPGRPAPARRDAQAERGDRRHPHAADAHRRGRCAPRRRSASATPTSACSCSPQYVEPSYALELLSESAEGVGYLLKDRVSDVAEFADGRPARRRGRLGARPDGRLAGSWADGGATTRSRRSPRASGRCSS